MPTSDITSDYSHVGERRVGSTAVRQLRYTSLRLECKGGVYCNQITVSNFITSVGQKSNVFQQCASPCTHNHNFPQMPKACWIGMIGGVPYLETEGWQRK